MFGEEGFLSNEMKRSELEALYEWTRREKREVIRYGNNNGFEEMVEEIKENLVGRTTVGWVYRLEEERVASCLKRCLVHLVDKK